MSTSSKNVRKNRGSERTSTEAAAAPQNLEEVRFTVASELEAMGELPGAFHLPPPDEETIVRPHPSAPLHAVTDLELAVKWGVSDYDQLMEDEYARRVTRGSVRAIRNGQSAVSGGGTYRGHRGTRERLLAASETERALQAQPEDVGSSADVVALADQDRDSEAEDAERVCAELEPATSSEGWKTAVGGSVRAVKSNTSLAVASRYFPSWFDLAEVEDQLGPIPVEWFYTATAAPVLPDLAPVNLSILDEIWKDVAAVQAQTTGEEDEQRELELALAASVQTAELERVNREDSEVIVGLTSRAMIVTVDSESEPEAPAGPNGRYSQSQKGKDVPRDAQQREFLRRFASCEPSTSVPATKAGAPQPNGGKQAKPSNRAKDKTV